MRGGWAPHERVLIGQLFEIGDALTALVEFTTECFHLLHQLHDGGANLRRQFGIGNSQNAGRIGDRTGLARTGRLADLGIARGGPGNRYGRFRITNFAWLAKCRFPNYADLLQRLPTTR